MASDIDEIVKVWLAYIEQIKNWQELVKNIQPKATGCGILYDIPNPINRPKESLAVADMRNLRFSWPHYHTNGETEIYIVISGNGKVVVGNKVSKAEKGSVIITPPDTAHCALPEDNLVLAVVNNPTFDPSNSVDVTEDEPTVSYDHAQFLKLSKYYPNDSDKNL